MQLRSYGLAAATLALVALSACGKAETKPTSKDDVATTASKVVASQADAASAKPNVEPREPALEVSKPKDYKSETEPSALGVVPKGVGLRPAAAGAAPVIAPDFSLADSDGKAQTLGGLVSKGPILLVFYRGGW